MPSDATGGGCRFLDDDHRACGAPRRDGSSYCARHHAICYVAVGSRAERQHLQVIETIGTAVGGRTAGRGAISRQFVRRIERLQP